jgi:hypothetical protein
MRRTVLGFAARLGAVLLLPLGTGLVWSHPGSGIGVDRRGNVYFVDTGQGVLRIGEDRTLTRLPGPALHWMTIDVADRFAKTRLPSFFFGEITRRGRIRL